SDSAGTFVTCVGVLGALVTQFARESLKGSMPLEVLGPYDDYAPAKYMSVMLAVMEIPGCLVGLYLISGMRRAGMDRWGNMPDEAGYMQKPALPPVEAPAHGDASHGGHDSPRPRGHAAPPPHPPHRSPTTAPAPAPADAT